MIDGVRVLYATAGKEYKTGTDGTDVRWIINPEAKDDEPQLYTYIETSDSVYDSAVSANDDMERLINAGRRFSYVLDKRTETCTLTEYNSAIKAVLSKVASVIASYSTKQDSSGETVGCLLPEGMHFLDKVFCSSALVKMECKVRRPAGMEYLNEDGSINEEELRKHEAENAAADDDDTAEDSVQQEDAAAAVKDCAEDGGDTNTDGE